MHLEALTTIDAPLSAVIAFGSAKGVKEGSGEAGLDNLSPPNGARAASKSG